MTITIEDIRERIDETAREMLDEHELTEALDLTWEYTEGWDWSIYPAKAEQVLAAMNDDFVEDAYLELLNGHNLPNTYGELAGCLVATVLEAMLRVELERLAQAMDEAA